MLRRPKHSKIEVAAPKEEEEEEVSSSQQMAHTQIYCHIT